MNQNNQKLVLRRCVKQWFTWLTALLLFVTVASVWCNPEVSVLEHGFNNFAGSLPVVVASLLLFPFCVYDSLKATNEITGPIARLHSKLKNLNDSQDFKSLKCREGDRWAGLAEDFNALAAEIERNRSVADSKDKKQRVYSISE